MNCYNNLRFLADINISLIRSNKHRSNKANSVSRNNGNNLYNMLYCFSFLGITNFDFLVHSLQYRCCCSGSFQWCCFIEVRNITYVVALFHSNNLNTFKHNLKNYFLNELKNSNDTIKIYFCFQLLKKLLDFNFEGTFVEGPQCKYKLL